MSWRTNKPKGDTHMPSAPTLSTPPVVSTDVISTRFLDDAAANLAAMRDVDETMAALISGLHVLRQTVAPDVWKQFTFTVFRNHPLMALLQQDPLTRRVYTKPRGYAGDAAMLDLIYAVEDGVTLAEVEASTELGTRIYACTAHAEAAEAVRIRRRLIAERVNDLAAQRPRPTVLSVACGHLREAARCSAVREGRIGRYVALDQDADSLAVVKRELGPLGIEPLHASVRDVIVGRVVLAGFDLVYAAGLYGYLPTRVAQQLTRALFEALHPGGRLLIGNYLPNIATAGFMEAALDWWLTYRSKGELLQLTDTLPERELRHIQIFTDDLSNVGFVEVERKE